MKQISKYFLILLSWFIAGSAFSQTAEYKKIELSVSAGKDYSIGKSNTPALVERALPLTKGFGASFDGVYYFTRNYGIGVKYHFYTVDAHDELFSNLMYDTNNDGIKETIDKLNTWSLDETTHFAVLSVYGKWTLSNSKWVISANAGVGYVYNKLSDLEEKIEYHYTSINWLISSLPPAARVSISDLTGGTVGATLSAGIRYQITPWIGIGISANGMFANLSKHNETPTTIDIPRKLNRIGISAGLNFNF
jgi:hypothetical protein